MVLKDGMLGLNRRHLQESKVIICFYNMQCTVVFQDEHDQTLPCSRDVWECTDFPALPHYWILVLSSSCEIKQNSSHSACKIAYRREKGFNYLQLSTGKLLKDIMRIKVIWLPALWLHTCASNFQTLFDRENYPSIKPRGR